MPCQNVRDKGGKYICMSIPSVHSQELHPDFTDLLAHYPNLAGWLSDLVQSKGELRAEELLPDFLTECSSQGVAGDAYPFTAEGWGLKDLQAYLRNARAEIEEFTTAETPRRSALESEPGAAESKEKGDLADRPTAQVPALTSQAQQADFIDRLPTEKTPVVELPIENPAQTDEGPQEQTTGDATSLEESETPTTEATQSAEVAEQETAALAVVEARSTSAEVAEQETATLTIVKPETRAEEIEGGEESDEKEAQELAPPGDHKASRHKRKRARRPRTRRQRILTWTLLLIILAAILVPAGFLVNFGINAYNTYHDLSNQAHTAVNQLLAVKTVFSGGKSHYSNLLDPNKLRQAQKDFAASGHDFQQLQNQLEHSDTLKTVTTYFPQYRATLSSALAASVVGIDVAKIGQIATANAIQLAPTFSGPLLAASGKPLVTQSILNTIGTTINQVQPLLNDIQAQAQQISLASLPISASEKTQVEQALQMLPQILNDLGIVRSLLGSAGWLLGVNHPRTFLVQTMDRAELRGAGGFTGQYGELTINGGRVAPFSLTDISGLDYNPTSANQGQFAPEQYRSWWPFANFGLRDSNISPDFPTAAQLAINLYKEETGRQVDGVISFTPVLIEHILAIIGPIQVPYYNTTVTEQNLEDVLHYYQLDNGGILKQYLVNQQHKIDTSTSDRKSFTSFLASLLMAKVRSAPPNELLSIARQVLDDLKTKELQVYFADPSAEHILTQYDYSGQLDRSTTHDGLYVVQQNLSESKASQYVQTIMHDTVTLDSKGGATHVLQIRLVYSQAGQVYGYDTYYDYLRVYVPSDSRLISGDGFSSGTPLCGGDYGSCPVNGVYPGGELTCPAGQYQPGQSSPSLQGSNGYTWQPLQTLSGPTNTTSDEPGRAMYGGWVIVPKNCTMNVTLSWYVPPTGHSYSLLVQRQAGIFSELDLSILPDAANCAQLGTSGLHFDGFLLKDTSFTPPVYKPAKQSTQGCYPHSGV